jgi:hypothetical protein
MAASPGRRDSACLTSRLGIIANGGVGIKSLGGAEGQLVAGTFCIVAKEGEGGRSCLLAEESGSRTHQGPAGDPFSDLKSGRPTGDASPPDLMYQSPRAEERCPGDPSPRLIGGKPTALVPFRRTKFSLAANSCLDRSVDQLGR